MVFIKSIVPFAISAPSFMKDSMCASAFPSSRSRTTLMIAILWYVSQFLEASDT